jgi:hypothetical protein
VWGEGVTCSGAKGIDGQCVAKLPSACPWPPSRGVVLEDFIVYNILTATHTHPPNHPLAYP